MALYNLIGYSGFLLPRREGVKGGAISGGLRQIRRDHMYAPKGYIHFARDPM